MTENLLQLRQIRPAIPPVQLCHKSYNLVDNHHYCRIGAARQLQAVERLQSEKNK